MRKILHLSFFALGFSSLIFQVIIIRELAMSFYANEFFIGWILFCWLFSTATGSYWGSRFSLGQRGTAGLLALFHTVSALLFPLTIAVTRFGKTWLGTPPGAFPEFIPSLFYSFIVLLPLCGISGAQFAVAVRAGMFCAAGEEPFRTAGRAYLWETLGFVAGGILFSFVLVFVNEFRAVSFLTFLNLGIATALLFVLPGKPVKVRWGIMAAAWIVPAGLWMAAHPLQQRTSQWRFPNETLLRTENTLHGNVSVTRLGNQYDLYQNGLLLGTDREDLTSEYLVHFPMLAHPAPRKVLLLGSGFNGPLQQILKHDPQEVCAIELDPGLLRTVRGFLPADLQAVLRDPRVKLGNADPRDFLEKDRRKFDVIIANFPDPVSVLINRNYTEQCFRLIRSRLAPGGIFSLHMTFSANALTPVIERLGSSVYATLNQVFPFIKVLPEDTLYFLASADRQPIAGPEEMTARFSERKIRTDFVTLDQIRYRLTNDRVGKVTTAFRGGVWKTKNTDLWPRTCYLEFLRWLAQFNPGLTEAFFTLNTLPFPVFLSAVLLMIVFLSVLTRGSVPQTRRLASVSMGAAGFSMMACEIIMIYLFQAAFGDLYYRLAWLVTALMAGLGAGTWLGLYFQNIRERFLLAAFHILNMLLAFGSIRILVWMFTKGSIRGEEYQAAFLGMAFAGGFAAGAIFPLANRLYLSRDEGKRCGHIYAADLWGAAFGALLTAGFLIPIWGIRQTLVLLGAGNALVASLFLFRKDLGRKDL